MDNSFAESLRETATRIHFHLDNFLPLPQEQPRLIEAMRYAALNDGKAFRAFLCLETARLCNAPEPQAERVAVAIEAAHCYSLIHDDLPAMDDDAMRRGQPSVHIAYDEATALLAGTSLLALAFEILADAATHPQATTRTQLISELAQSTGAQGMMAGQMLDILATPDMDTPPLDIGELAHLHALKTGAMMRYAVRAGGLLGGADAGALRALTDYANALGLAYQITDDVLDAESETQDGKETFATLLGVVEARHEARRLTERGVASLAAFGEAAEPLRQAAAFVIAREN